MGSKDPSTTAKTTEQQDAVISLIKNIQNVDRYQQLTWEGSFEEYLEIVRKTPAVTRNAFQRIYDMILSYGTEEYTEYNDKIIKYKFFDDPIDNGRDAVYGLARPLMKMVHLFKAAAKGYGTEKRVFLLHGPVGSSKSTIVRLMKKGLEAYSKTEEGALFTYFWKVEDDDGMRYEPCPMHQDPLQFFVQPHGKIRLEKFGGNFLIGQIDVGYVFQVVDLNKFVKGFGGDHQGFGHVNVDVGELALQLAVFLQSCGHESQAPGLAPQRALADFDEVGVRIVLAAHQFGNDALLATLAAVLNGVDQKQLEFFDGVKIRGLHRL